MDDFESKKTKSGFSMKLLRGERMSLIGFDLKTPEPDLVGFSIECKEPKAKGFVPLRNRIAFDDPAGVANAVDGNRKYLSTEAPFQKFRWVHFPFNPQKGIYTYRATKLHMPKDGTLKKGTAIDLGISLDPVTYDKFLDVGFTRGFASSQAFLDRVPKGQDKDEFGKSVIPSDGDKGLEFPKLKSDIYSWMGFEAYDLIFGLLDEALKDKTVTLDVFAYDLNEPSLVGALEKLGKRVRIIIDDSTSKNKAGVITGHGTAESPESQSADRLSVSAGEANVRRTHFQGLQHHKVIVFKKDGKAAKVLTGSTNFSFRGIYIQANNAMLFHNAEVADLYARVFQRAFDDPATFSADDLASKWHLVQATGKPAVHICFSPHKSTDLSLNPVRGAIDQASSSVFYSVAFLNQIRSGPTKEAFDRLIARPIFSYGLSDKAGGLEVKKPDGSTGLVDFKYLAANAPEPFKSEWSGGSGINVHHKFVVTDFNLATAKVFTGSSNLSPSGEKGNGDHLIMIEDRKIATSYAIEALRVFDHLHFRSNMKESAAKNTKISLRKPTAISGKPAWFEDYYKADTQRQRDRELFGN